MQDITKAQVLTTNCRRFFDLSLDAGITCTFMIWMEPGRALWRAPISRSVTTQTMQLHLTLPSGKQPYTDYSVVRLYWVQPSVPPQCN